MLIKKILYKLINRSKNMGHPEQHEISALTIGKL